MIEHFFFGVSMQTVVIIALVLIIIILLISRRQFGGATALAASVPLFWFFARKMGQGEQELSTIQAEYDRRLKALQEEFNMKMEALRQSLHSELTRHQQRAADIQQEIEAKDIVARERVKNASPDELESIARALISISKK